MAIHLGPPMSGKIGGVVYVQFNGKTYVRQAPSVSKTKIKRSPYYERTRLCNELWATATQYVKTVYYVTPRSVREHGLFGKLVGMFYKKLCGRKPVIEAICEVEEVMLGRMGTANVSPKERNRFETRLQLLKKKEGH